MESIETRTFFPTRREIAGRIFRQRTVFLLTFAAVMLGFLLTGQFKPKYRAEMKVLVRKQRVDPVVTTGQDSTPQLQGVEVHEEELNSEAEILKGQDLLRQVVPQAGLVPAGTTDPVTIERAVRTMQRHLDVSVVAKTDLISIRYESHNAEQARRVLATLAALYLKTQRTVHGPDFQVSFFDEQVRAHGRMLQAAEGKLLDFTRRTGIVSAGLERELTVRQLEELKQQRLENAAEIAEVQGSAGQLRAQLAAAPARLSTDEKKADNPQLLNQMNTTLLNLQLKRTDLLNKYDAHYRLVEDVDAEIATTERMIQTQLQTPTREDTSGTNPTHLALESAFATSQAQLTGLRAKAHALASSSAAVQKTAENLVAGNTEQEALLRDVKTEKDEYQLYVDKLEQARMTHSLDEGGILNVGVVQDPTVPPLPENALLSVLAASLFAATLLGFAAAFLADVLDPTVRNAADLSEGFGLPTLAEFGPMHSFEGGQL